ncbi:MAG: polysaccharide deacetylase family protein [Eubacteriaceae bacterium]|nr:polysaccharide deacetylase family protein [Eubacteriaceae bacterium]
METTLLYFVIFIFSTAAVYVIIPEIFVHFLGIGSWKRQYSPGVTLTFDDGPDPRYTSRVLKLLAENKVPGCFFLVAENAVKYPELVKNILEDGHKIGCHGYHHRHAWLMSPLTTWNLWNNALIELERITDQELIYVRAPWGGVNLAFLVWCRVKNKKIIGWNASGRDWLIKKTPVKIIDRIIGKSKEGTIVLLHDSGGEEGSPENTLASLEMLCRKIRKDLKLPLVPLELPDWSFSKRLGFRIWEKWETLYANHKRITRIDENNIYRLSRDHYNGPDLFNSHGQLLATKDDLVGILHLDNIRFQGLGDSIQKIGLSVLRQARLSLPVLASYVHGNPDFKDIKVLLGVTLINRGVKGLGFSVEEYPNDNAGFIGFMQQMVYRVYNPAGKHNLGKHNAKPKIVWISKEELFERYLNS